MYLYHLRKGPTVRVLLLSNLYPPYVDGGAEIVAADFAVGLEHLGHEVVVLTSSYGLSKGQEEENVWRILDATPAAHFDRQRPLWQQLDQPYNYYRSYHNPNNVRQLHRIIAEICPDVLYIWEIPGIGVNSFLEALPDLSIPVVFHLESYWLLYAQSPETAQSRLRAQWLKKLLIGSVPRVSATSLIACSSTVKQKYMQSGISADLIEVIYNGIDDRFLGLSHAPDNSIDNKSATKKDIQLLYVGRLSLEKGVLTILKALDILVNERGRQDLYLNIFGKGDEIYERELHDFLRDKNLTYLVTFHGRVTQDELIKHYDSSDIMLVPSLWQEPFGLVVAEAMARGLPIIAANVGGPAEMIVHERNGLLVEPGDEQELTTAIIRLVENPDERSNLSSAARITVLERFSIEENVRLVEQHLLRAVQKGHVY